ncbi:methyltransferase-like protein 27 isoform X2 [Callorhinchus milii]|uniref:Methyltransferase type 11 domain-containing protein n=1 Tax=Callorhinchus milii TaxID=7868 RepID=A0A4W3IXF9_CALMI|nr:methyltransferase-like protein 27 isoform X2 [Callorhinchus milii]|eukprot:gi/632957633/ref/XP_007894592.1/ PREDICTED: Williams-Beuren syndrome chromosomal region 27 protein isoform X2 [Callorhinchus milii]
MKSQLHKSRMATDQRTFADAQRAILFAQKDKTIDEKMTFYNTWAKCYEQDVALLDYQAPIFVKQSLAALFTTGRDQALVLDVACGTGLVAQQLQGLGFHHIHGVDGSEGMLEIAQSKGLYESLQKCMLGMELLPASPDSYDVTMIVGALSDGQVPPTILPELHRVTKSGGYVCMTTRTNIANQLYKKQLVAVIEDMEQRRLWDIVKVQQVEHWERAVSASGVEQDSEYISGIIYICRKSSNQQSKNN